jgi:hypothetical protein
MVTFFGTSCPPIRPLEAMVVENGITLSLLGCQHWRLSLAYKARSAFHHEAQSHRAKNFC